jgi:uncharacterized protein (UPF0261 family)
LRLEQEMGKKGPSEPTVLILATLDTKHLEAGFLRDRIESHGCRTLLMDTGVFEAPEDRIGGGGVIPRQEVAAAAGASLEDLIASKDKGRCIHTMMEGAQALTRRLHYDGRFHGVIAIGGAQGTDIGTAAMRVLPFGIPKFMVSTVASGRAAFGPYVGTRDIIMMHSVADLQGLNVLTTRVLANSAAAVCGMVKSTTEPARRDSGVVPVAMSMLGTTTPGALRAKAMLESRGFEVVAFHQNGTGGIAMEDMILEGMFEGVLDINLHEIGDYVAGGLHGAIRDDRLEAAGKLGIPQVVAPGSINYTVQGPYAELTEMLKTRKYIIHNPNLTLVRLSHEELAQTAELTARKLNQAKGPVHVFIPLKGFSYPDREGLNHWEPESNHFFIERFKQHLSPAIPLQEIEAHINDAEFIDPVVETFISLMRERGQDNRAAPQRGDREGGS